MKQINRRSLLTTGLALLVPAAAAGAARPEAWEEELHQAAASLPAEREAARNAGIPLTVAELVAVPVPPEQDAAPLYAQIAHRLEAQPKAEVDEGRTLLRRVIDGKASGAEQVAAGAFLARWEPLLHLARQAVARPRCQFDLDWILGPELRESPTSGMRYVAQLHLAQALQPGAGADLAGALECLSTALQVARHIGQEPTVAAQMMRNWVQKETDQVFGRLVEERVGDVAALEHAAAWHQRLDVLPDLRLALRGEALVSLKGARKPAEALAHDPTYDPRTPAELKYDRLLLRQSEALLRDAFETRILALYRKALAALNAPAVDLSEAHQPLKELAVAERLRQEPSYRLSREVADTIEMAGAFSSRAAAVYRLRTTFLVVLQTFARTGTFPDHLPEAAIDPYSGKPLRYVRTTGGFTLTSAGPPHDPGKAPREIVLSYPQRKPEGTGK